MIIDFHTHLFPDDVAEYAMRKLSGSSKVSYDCFPTRSELLQTMDAAGIDKSVVLNIATREHQHKNILSFAQEINSERLISFGSVMPASESALDCVSKIHDAGIKGLKFHPALQRFKPEDKNNFPVYDLARALDLIVLFHAGWDPTYEDELFCPPQSIIEVEKNFPGLKIVAAHMGGLKLAKEVLEVLAGHNVYFDTAWTAEPWIDKPMMEKLIVKHGADKVLFGSDFPWNDPWRELTLISCLNLPSEDRDLILGGNAERLLSL